MRRSILVLLTATMTLTACATIRDSRVNPFNWFGRDRSEEPLTAEPGLQEDPRPLISQVTSLQVDPTPEGAIIRAVGLPPTQGFWKAELVAVDTDDPSVLAYEFRVFPPVEQTRQSTQQSREVVVGADISSAVLKDTRRIVIIGRNNSRSVNR